MLLESGPEATDLEHWAPRWGLPINKQQVVVILKLEGLLMEVILIWAGNPEDSSFGVISIGEI